MQQLVYYMKPLGVLFFTLTYLVLEVNIFVIIHFSIEYSGPYYPDELNHENSEKLVPFSYIQI